MNKDWEYFFTIFGESVAQIGSGFFQIERYKDVPTLRERVYCYELYHQLRLRLAEQFQYMLHGEIDKSGHDWVIELFGGNCPNPDFVVHVPGTPKSLVVIEVKTSKRLVEDIENDIEKLLTFITKVNYYRAIMLIFGRDRIKNVRIPDKRIITMWHEKPGEVPTILNRY